MSGEAGKRSGEIGEALAFEIINLIGWGKSLSSIKIPCTSSKKHTTITHGIDRLFCYTNPFNPNTSDVIHISVKHAQNGYPKGPQGIRTTLKDHISELNRIVECAKKSSTVEEAIQNFHLKSKRQHRGLLIWVHGHLDSITLDLRETFGVIELHRDHTLPITLIDSGRASFIYESISHFKNKYEEDFNFYYPRMGSGLSTDAPRYGKYLPLELIASDIIPIRRSTDGKPFLSMYIRDNFSEINLIKSYALARDFGDAWVGDIEIGFSDFNESTHGQIRDRAMLSFAEAQQNVSVFCFNGGLLSLLEKKNDV